MWNEEWKMESEERRMGEWAMKNGKLKMGNCFFLHKILQRGLNFSAAISDIHALFFFVATFCTRIKGYDNGKVTLRCFFISLPELAGWCPSSEKL